MATIALGLVGAAIGGYVGGPAGARLGFSIGVAVGGVVETAMQKPQSLGRLNDLHVTGSQYGATIPWIWGRSRVGGTVIWATDLVETARKKGSKLTGSRTQVYTYSIDCAVLLCHGPVTGVLKIWAEDTVIYDSASGLTPSWIHVHLGDTTQTPDATILADPTLGAGFVPAYRGRCYVVFDNLPLAEYGNRLPNFSFLVENLNTAESTVLTDGPVLLYKFETGQQLVDSSGSGYDLSVFAGTFGSVAGKYGQGVSAATSAQAQRGSVPSEPFLSDQLTVEGWFQYKGGSPSGNGNSTFRFYGNNDFAWDLEVAPDLFAGNTYLIWKQYDRAGNSTATIHQYAVVRDTLWHHVAVVVDSAGATSKLYYDGALLETQIPPVDVSVTRTDTTTLDLLVRDNYRLDELAFFSRSLSASELAARVVASASCTLKRVLADLFREAGLAASQYDLSQATDTVRGYLVGDRTEARAAAQPPCQCFFTDLAEGDGKIKAVKRGGAPVLTVSANDMGAEVTDGSDLTPRSTLSIRRLQELELPFRIDLTYFSANKEYQQGEQHSVRFTKSWLQEQVTVATSLVFTEDEARQVVERLNYTAWTERETFETTLLPKYLGLLPADVVSLPVPGATVRARVQEVSLALPGPVGLRLVLDEPSVLTQSVAGGAVTVNPLGTGAVVATTLFAWNGNAARDADADSVGLYLAANGSSAGFWSGAVVYLSRDAGASYQEIETVEDPATFGTASTVLAAGTQTEVWDDINTVDILLTGGTDKPPVTMSDADVLAGGNQAVIGDEYIQYGTVVSLGGNSYRLSHLLRGRRGTDPFWDEHRTGERVVIENGGAKRAALPTDIKSGTLLMKAVGNGQQLADVSPITVRVYGRETLEYAGVGLTATRDGSNNATLTWTRRARKNGEADWGDGASLPLDVLAERYVVYPVPASGTAITAITQATQAVVTAAGHGLAAGDLAYLAGIAGMLPLNDQIATVVSVAGNDVTLDVDSSQFPAWVSGGTIRKPTRTISTTSPSASYPAANATTDGLPPAGPVTFVVAALGDDGRRGYSLVGSV